MPPTSPQEHPRLLLLGPVQLINAHGSTPERAMDSCCEYLAWLTRNPGGSGWTMSRDLIIADGTRRSNLSRLRAWLGRLPDGAPYLPDAYGGRFNLDERVDTDWDQVALLLAPNLDDVADAALRSALGLVRGAPLADTPPGCWSWAEDWRLDMTTTLRDAGVALANRALEQLDLDLARWAATRALMACPGDTTVLGLRLRVEYLAGNRAEARRLALSISRQARTLGIAVPDDLRAILQRLTDDDWNDEPDRDPRLEDDTVA
ncbi:MAG: bacterial transcriptional activator domain-containing protein [Actinomycetia bacterium]|nr:bacterial transcriptional activator domain-containing protein [Actinomycetes bacterium]